MNILFILVIGIFAVSAMIGYRRGFIKIAASLAITILTIVLVATLTPVCSGLLLKMIPLEKRMQDKCYEILIPEHEDSAESEVEYSSREEQISMIEHSKLPDTFQQLLLANNNDEIYRALGVTSFTDYVGSYMARIIANIISFIVLVIVVSIVLKLVLKALGLVGKIPVVGSINRLAGAVIGIAVGLIVVWILFLLITLSYSTSVGQTCYQYIIETPFLKNIYDHNILLNTLTKFR